MNAFYLRAATLLCLLGASACSQPKSATNDQIHQTTDHAVVNEGSQTSEAQVNSTSPSAASKGAHANPRSPMRVALSGPDRVPKMGEMTLSLDISRVNAAMVPIIVRLTLPAGVKLISGAVSEQIAEKSSLKLTRTWRLSYAKLPLKDATVVVDWQTSGGGFHAELPWRFGRVAPKKKQLTRLPEVRTRGGFSLGRPILTGGGTVPKADD